MMVCHGVGVGVVVWRGVREGEPTHSNPVVADWFWLVNKSPARQQTVINISSPQL